MAHADISNLTAISDCLIEYVGRGFSDAQIAEILGSINVLERLGHLVTTEDVIMATLTYGISSPDQAVVDAAVKVIIGPGGYRPTLAQCVRTFRNACLRPVCQH